LISDTAIPEDGILDIHPAPIPVVSLQHQDTVFPVCHAGQNRSQVLWTLLCDINNVVSNGTGRVLTVKEPHGAESGFDAYVDVLLHRLDCPPPRGGSDSQSFAVVIN